MPADAAFTAHELRLVPSKAPLDTVLRCALPILPPRHAPAETEAPTLLQIVERPCPYGARPTSHIQAMITSGSLHAVMLVAVITMMPQAMPDPGERGGLPDVMAVMLVGEAEILAREDGTRSVPGSLVSSDPARRPNTEPADPVVDVPAPDVPQIPAISQLLQHNRRLAEPGPEASEVRREPVVAPVAKAKATENTAAIAPPRGKQEKPAKQKAMPSRVAEAEPRNANGTNGHGLAKETRAAARQGGTGGAKSFAGANLHAGYAARLRALIERQKMYPEQAQERGQTGKTTVTLVVARDGRLAAVQIVQGSGHALLDSATLAAIRRAQPFPAMAEGSPPVASFTLALSYALN